MNTIFGKCKYVFPKESCDSQGVGEFQWSVLPLQV